MVTRDAGQDTALGDITAVGRCSLPQHLPPAAGMGLHKSFLERKDGPSGML